MAKPEHEAKNVVRRPWWRPHRSTCVLVVLLLLCLGAVVAGGDRVFVPRWACEHGWPLVFLRREAAVLSVWSWTDHVTLFEPVLLGIDVTVALVLLALVAFAAERRRRRRRGFWQIRFWETVAVLLVLGGLAGWVTYLRARTSAQLEILAQFKDERTHFIEYWDTEPNWFTEIFDPDGYRSEQPLLGDVVQIELTDHQISAEQLAGLAPLDRLQSLGLGGDVETAGLAHLADLPSLRLLTVMNSDLDEEALRHVGRLAQLDYLFLDYSRFSDAALVQLRSLTSLRWLDLSKSTVRDAGLVHVGRLAHLEALDLSDTSITDAGLVHLGELSQLEALDVTNTQVTANGAGRLQRALPKLEVLY